MVNTIMRHYQIINVPHNLMQFPLHTFGLNAESALAHIITNTLDNTVSSCSFNVEVYYIYPQVTG